MTVTLWLVALPLSGSQDSIAVPETYPGDLLRLKVPETFQKERLRMIFHGDSSWQVLVGDTPLDIQTTFLILGVTEKSLEYEAHLKQRDACLEDYRARRVFSSVAAVFGTAYLYYIWDRGWLYQIPGYAILSAAAYRFLESRRAELAALREEYFIRTIMRPSEVQERIDDYNFKLYQKLSTAGIKFSESP